MHQDGAGAGGAGRDAFLATTYRGAFGAHLHPIEPGDGEEGRLAEGSHCQRLARGSAEQHPTLSQSDCFEVYRKEWCWCGVQRFSKIGPPLGLLSDLLSRASRGFIESSSASETDSACAVAKVVAVGRSAAVFTRILRSRQKVSLFRRSGAATGRYK